MKDILLVSAWVILVIGLFGVIVEQSTHIKKWFISLKINYFWLILITIVAFIFLTYPYFFNLWAIYFWHVPETELSDYTKLGPLGDLYGSLNTLISSIALCAVAYSTWLQVTSLKETRDATTRQLELAEKNHQEQLKESKDAIAVNNFFNLLNYKEQKYRSLFVKNADITKDADLIFSEIKNKIVFLFENEWKDISNVNKNHVHEKMTEIMKAVGRGCPDAIYVYFSVYIGLINTIKDSPWDKKTKSRYSQLLCDSMNINEQIVFFVISSYVSRLNLVLENSNIFGVFNEEIYVSFGLKFHKKSHFWTKDWRVEFDKKKQTPT